MARLGLAGLSFVGLIACGAVVLGDRETNVVKTDIASSFDPRFESETSPVKPAQTSLPESGEAAVVACDHESIGGRGGHTPNAPPLNAPELAQLSRALSELVGEKLTGIYFDGSNYVLVGTDDQPPSRLGEIASDLDVTLIYKTGAGTETELRRALDSIVELRIANHAEVDIRKAFIDVTCGMIVVNTGDQETGRFLSEAAVANSYDHLLHVVVQPSFRQFQRETIDSDVTTDP